MIDQAGATLAMGSSALPPSRRDGAGGSEQDPQHWWQAVVLALGQLPVAIRARIRALSIDGTSATLLLAGPDGVPCGPALMYDDRRAQSAAELIAAHAPADSPARGPGSALAKLLYLIRQHAAQTPAPAYALHQADWIAGRLLGRYGHSDENNALKLGYDPIARHWPDWVRALPGVAALLPAVHPAGAPLGQLCAAAAQQLGLAAGIRVIAGTTDSNAATLAAGIDRPGDAVSSLGSTLVLKIYSEQPVNAARYGVYSHRIGERWLVGGASNSGGAVLRQYFSDREIADRSAQIDPQRPLDLGYYPLPAVGERFPYQDPRRASRIQPIPPERTLFLQALLEGIADIEAAGYARLAELGAPPPQRVFSSGGGAVNEAWRQIREARLGVPVLRAAHTEAAYGAALLAQAADRPATHPA